MNSDWTAPVHTVWVHIIMLLQEQSDLGPHCLSKSLKSFQQTTKADNFCCEWCFIRVNTCLTE